MKSTSTLNGRYLAYEGRSFLSAVFGWMGLGLAITSIISYWVYSTPAMLSALVTENGLTGLGYIIMFAPLIFVLIMSFGFNRLSYMALLILFILYSALMGASLSFIFLVYSGASIVSTFIVGALMFGTMAVIGYTTKTDLTKMGNILVMVLIGMIIASLVNLFMKSDSFSYVISFIGVIVFSGLTAWDLQKIKNMSAQTMSDSETKSKLGILGALTLYLDFINLFLSLLRIFGRRKS